MSLVVTKALGISTVQDFGRLGRMHEGLSHGGALVRALLVRANRAARNPDDLPGIEVLGQLGVRATESIEIGLDTGPRTLHAGEEILIESGQRRAAYLAVRGGVAVPMVLSGRGAHLAARIGAPLRAGSVIAAHYLAERVRTTPEVFDDTNTIRVIPGPDMFPSPISGTYKISSTSDRTGTRLEGPPIAREGVVERTRPMTIGAIEVPRDGMPIVLGPEHPTTGGYPVIGVIASEDLDRFHAIRLGGTVRFVSDSRAPAHRRA